MAGHALIKGKLLAKPVITSRFVTPRDEKVGYNETIVSIYVEIEMPKGVTVPERAIFYYVERENSNEKNGIGKLAKSLATQIAFSEKGQKICLQVSTNKAGLLEEKIIYFYNFTTKLGNMTQGK